MEPCTSCENLGIISTLDREEIVRLRKELERSKDACVEWKAVQKIRNQQIQGLREELAKEKANRVHYQGIVYHLCNLLDSPTRKVVVDEVIPLVTSLKQRTHRAEADSELLNQMVTRCNAAESDNVKLKEMLNAII